MAIISIPTSVAGVALPGSLGGLAKGPLSALFAGNGVQTLQYPSDLATDPSRAHYIQFSIKEIVPAGWNTTNGTPVISGIKVGAGGVKAGIDLASSVASRVNQSLVENSSTAATVENAVSNVPGQVANSAVGQKVAQGTNFFTNALGLDKLAGKASDVLNFFGSTVIGQTLKEGLSITPQTTTPRAVISLYMPDTLNAGYTSHYDTPSLQDAFGSTIQGLRSLAKTAGQFAGGADLKSIISSDPGVINLQAKAAGAVTGLAGGNAQATQSLILQAQGYAINPQVQMLYTGIDLRSFQLSFTFTPKSVDETEQVDKIISMFKYYSSPALQAGAQTQTDSMFLIPPALFNVNFMINSVENRYLPKYGDCVLESMEVNYAPNGWSSFESGAPVQTTLSLSFKETQIIDKSKLQKGDLR
jgi:hypothetical protein